MSETAASGTRPATATPAIEGWFKAGDEPVLLGNRCTACGTVFFPKASFACRNPDCDGTEFADTELSRRGHIWSFTDAQYQPPPPYIPRGEPFQPFAIAAVELAEERMVVMGQVADGFTADDLHVGDEVELVVEPLFTDETGERLIWRWRPVAASAGGAG